MNSKQEQSAKILKLYFSENPKVATLCTHRSKTNLKAEYRIITAHKNDIVDITWHVGNVLNANGKHGVIVRGCGFDRAAHLISNLEYELYGVQESILSIYKMWETLK